MNPIMGLIMGAIFMIVGGAALFVLYGFWGLPLSLVLGAIGVAIGERL